MHGAGAFNVLRSDGPEGAYGGVAAPRGGGGRLVPGIKPVTDPADDTGMSERLADDAALSVDQVASLARRERHEVLTAIGNRALAAHQSRGEWVVIAADMRRWLARH